jgi:hypothetical protein
MTTYRTAGAWGAGKGSNLSPAEVDENFYGHEERILSLETSPAAGVSVVSFTVVGRRFSVNLSDSTVQGPYLLPVAAFRWSGEWVAGTTYEELDVFTRNTGDVDTDGVYLVFGTYVAPSISTEDPDPFDPLVEDTNGPLLEKMLGVAPTNLPVRRPVADFTLGATHAGAYTRIDNTGDTTAVSIDVWGADEPPEGTRFVIRNAGDMDAMIVPLVTAVTINYPLGMEGGTFAPGATVTLTYVGGDAYDAAGDFTLSTI